MIRENASRQTTTTYVLSRPLAKTLALLLAALGLALPVRAQTPVMEATNADATTVLQVNDDGGLLGLGVFDTGVIPAEGAGTRLMWHPAKAALRAGRVGVSFVSDGSEWDDENVGVYSVAFGAYVTASGSASTAMGFETTASGGVSTAMGEETTASGFRSMAMGFRTEASGSASTAMGFETTANGGVSTAMGNATTASGDVSTAMGQQTTASGNHSTAMGRRTTAKAYGSLVIGRSNVIAGNPISWEDADPLFVAGNGSGDASRSNALTLLKNGTLTIAGTLTESSDRRLKTAVAPLEGVLGALEGVEPIRYRFKEGTGRPAGPQIGLIAQEVAQAFPELVTRGADGYLSVAYPKLTAVLLRGVQEQQGHIEAQQTQIETLEARLAALERGRTSHALALMAGPAGATALFVLLLLGGLVLWRRRASFALPALPAVLLVVAASLASLGTTPAQAQTVTVQNGGILHVANGGVLDLHGATLDLGDVGETARLEEMGGGRVTGGLLTATRELSSPSRADIAGLGAIITSDQALGATTITRGHDVQFGGPNQSIRRYYDITPATRDRLDATLVFRYNDAELGGLSEKELVLFRSADGGRTWRLRGADDSDEDANTVTLNGIDAFSRWTLGASSQPLPVELTAFEATLDGEAVQLTWATASETNNAGFHVERALGEGEDDAAEAWTTVGFIEGAGTTSTTRTYSYRDAVLPFGADRLRYRLRQVDLDGTVSHSPDVEVQLDAPERVALHAPYPNPLAGRATVRYELPQAARVRLAVYNALGQRMAVLADGPQTAGRKEIALEARRWPSGMYFVRLEVGGAAYTRKLTVVR